MESICFFNKFKSWGGGEKWHYEAANFFQKNGYKISVICHGKGELLKRMKKNKNISSFKTTGRKYAYLNIFTVLRMVYFLKKNKIDTIIYNSFEDVRLGGFAAVLAGVKVQIFRSGMPKYIKEKKLQKFFQKYIDIIFTNSLESKEIIENNNPFLRGKIRILKNGIIFSETDTEEKILESIIVMGNSARFDYQKDQKTKLQALKLLKDKNVKFKFLFAGDGELNSDLIKLRNQLGLEEVEFKGFMDNCDELYKNLDIFILSSIFEGSSNSLIEAMSFKDAVIVSDIQSNLEIIDNGRYGISFKVGSPEDLFEKLFDVINNKEKLLELKEKALEGVKKNYNYNVNMKNFENQLIEVHAKINGK